MSRVLLVTYGSRTEADVAVARLRSEGIEAVAVTDSAGGFEPQLDMIRGVRVLVPDADAGEARAVLGLSDDGASPPDTASASTVPPWARSVALWLLVLVVVGGIVTAVLDFVGG
jgi:hypothetical protein